MSQVHQLELEDMQSVGSLIDETQANELRKAKDNHDLRRKELSYKILPILRLMKLFGEYYDDVSMDEGLQSDSSVFSCFYCGMVLIGQYLFFEGLTQMKTFYLLLIFTIWYLQCAAFTTTCLFNLPKRQTKLSRFGRFFGSLLSTTSDFTGKKAHKVNLVLTFVCAFAVFNTVFLLILDFY